MELDPHDSMTRLSRANVFLMSGRVKEAAKEYNAAVRLQPSLSPAWIALGQISEKTGHRDDAQSYYRKVLENNTDVAQSPTVARFCQGIGWFEAAATNYDEAIKLDPINARLRLSAGRNLASLKRNAQAIEQYREAVRLKPKLIEARLALCDALANEGQTAEAMEQLEAALRSSPTNSLVLDYVRDLKARLDSQKIQ
jgi:Tfp pilus assembly protein PilF